MLEYTINKSSLSSQIASLVSRVADEAYGDNGMSLYDTIVLTEKDDDLVDGYIDEAISAFVARLQDICWVSTSSSDLSEKLNIYVPDFEESKENLAKDAITSFIVYSTCLEIFKSRRPQVVPEYEARALAALNKAITFLKSRKSPVDLW